MSTRAPQLAADQRRLGWRSWAAIVVAAWIVAVVIVFSRPYSDFVPAAPNPLVASGAVYEARCGAVLSSASVHIVSAPLQAEAVPSRPPCEGPRTARQRLAVLDVGVALLAFAGLIASSVLHRRGAR